MAEPAVNTPPASPAPKADAAQSRADAAAHAAGDGPGAGAMNSKTNRLARVPAQATPPAQAQDTISVAALAPLFAAAHSEILSRSQGQTKTEGLDATLPGGYYLVDGVYKNALGQEVHEIAADHPDDQPAKVK